MKAAMAAISEKHGNKLWKPFIPVSLLIVIIVLTLAMGTPASAASPIPVSVSLSDYTPCAINVEYTIYARLGTAWGPNEELRIIFPCPMPQEVSYSIGSSPVQYITDNTGLHNLAGSYSQAHAWGGFDGQNFTTFVVMMVWHGNTVTLPAGSTMIIKFRATNPNSSGPYTIGFATRTNDGQAKDSGSFTVTLSASTPPVPSLKVTTVGNGEVWALDPYTLDNVPQDGSPLAFGTEVELLAVQNDYYSYFDHWEGDLSGWQYIPDTYINKTIFVVKPTNVTAIFKSTVHVNVSCTGNGTVSPGTGDYAFHTDQTFTATPAPGWHFVNWTYNGSDFGSLNPFDFFMVPVQQADGTIVANNLSAVFAPNAVSINVTASGSGTVTKDPNSTSYTGDGTNVVQLSATAASGWRFDHWDYTTIDGDEYTATINPLVFTINTTGSGWPNTANYLRNGPVYVTATFIQPSTYYVNIGILGAGSLSASPVVPSPWAYIPGTQVTLTATPVQGRSTFDHWASSDITITDSDAHNASLTFTMPADDIRVLAYFAGNPFSLTANANPAEGGSVTLDPARVTYPYHSTVNLTATPNNGYHFTGWDGINPGSGEYVDGNKASVTIWDNRTVTANFAVNPYTVTYYGNGGTGTAPPPVSPTVGTDFTVAANTFIAPAGTAFSGWNTSASGTGTNYAAGSTMTMPVNNLILYAIWESNLIFSEYIEGGSSSYNRALEIYNPSGGLIDLASGGYNIQMYSNAGLSPDLTINLIGSVAPGDVFVIAHTNADSAIIAQSDQVHGLDWTSSDWFNGNDPIVLRKGTTIIDSFGQIGVPVANGWVSGDIYTWFTDLRRLPIITRGDTNPYNAFDPALEWQQFKTGLGQVDYSGLGSPDYSLAINATNGTVMKNPDQIGYNSGTSVELSAIPAENYHFLDWSGDSTGTANPTTVTMNGNKTITANFAIDTFTVIFESSGGNAVENQTVGFNGLVTAPAYPNKVNYTFGGWYKDEACTDPWDFTSEIVTSNLTLYAKWTIIPGTYVDQRYDVTYQSVRVKPEFEILRVGQTFTAEMDGALEKVSVLVQAIQAVGDTAFTLTVQIQGVDGATGKPNGTVLATGSIGIPFNSYDWKDIIFTSPPLITAGEQYAIVLDWPEGSQFEISGAGYGTDPYPGGKLYGTYSESPDVWLGPNIFAFGEPDMNFKTWVNTAIWEHVVAVIDQQYDVTYQSVRVRPEFKILRVGQTFTAEMDGALEKVSLLVQAIQAVGDTAFTLTVQIQGVDSATGQPNGTVLATGSIDIPFNSYDWKDIIFTSPPLITAGEQYAIVLDWPEGSQFEISGAGYGTDPYPGGKLYGTYSESPDVWLGPNIFAFGEPDMNFKTWVSNPAPYTVTFDSRGGSTIDSQYPYYGGPIIEPAAPTKEGTTFIGWYKDETCTDDWVFTTDTVRSDITLYAGWTVSSQAPAVTKNPEDQSITYGDNASFYAAATGDPVPVVQWQVSSDGGRSFNNILDGGVYSGAVTGNLTLTQPPVSCSGYQYQAVFTNGLSANATSSVATLTISKATATVALANLVQSYNGNPLSPTASTTPSGLTVSWTGVPQTNAGVYEVTAAVDDANYEASVSGNFTIEKADQIITFDSLTGKTYGDAPFALGASPSSGLPVTFSIVSGSASIDGNILTITGAGEVIVRASQSGDTNYNAAPGVTQSFTVAKADAVVSVVGYTGTYDGIAHGARGTATGVGGVDLGASLNLGDNFTNVPGGTAHWTFTYTNYLPESGDVVITISQASQVIGVTATIPVTATFGDSFTVTATGGASGNPVVITTDSIICTGSGNDSALISVDSGTGNGWIRFNQAGNTNYSAAAQVQKNVTAQKAIASIALNNLMHTYDGTAKYAGATTNPARLTINITYSQDGTPVTDPTNAGSYDVFAIIIDANNEGSQTGNMVITPADAVINVNGYTGIYDGVPYGAVGTATGVGGIDLYASLELGSTFTNVPGGIAHWTFSHPNYIIESGDVNIVITKATSEVNLSNLIQTYDGTARSATSSTNPAGLTVNITYSGLSTPPTNAGEYTVAATVDEINYEGSASGTLVINKVDAVINVNGYTGIYDGIAHGATGTAIGVNGTPVSGLDLGAAFSNVPGGIASWTFSNPDYNGQSGSVDIVLSKADATIVVTPYSVTYDGTAHTATGLATGVLGEALSGLDLSGTTHIDAGSYSADPWAFIDVTGNYNNANGTVDNQIDQAASTITIDLATLNQTYTGGPEVVTATTNPSGLSYKLTYNGSETAPVNVGSHAVVATITDPNYIQDTDSGTLVINKADAVIKVNGYTGTYDAIAYGASGTATGVMGEVLSGLDLGAVYTNVPGGTTSWIFIDNTGNYNNDSGSVEIVINQATPDIQVTGGTFTYDGKSHPALATATGVGGAMVSGTFAFTYNPPGESTEPVNAGTYNVSVSFTSTDSNYTDNSGEGSITIKKTSQIITVTSHAPSSAQYSDTFTVSATGGGSGNPVLIATDGVVCTGGNYNSATIIIAADAGTGWVKFTQEGNENYKPSEIQEFVSAIQENAYIAFDSQNPVAVRVASDSGKNTAFIWKVTISQADDGSPGNLNLIQPSDITLAFSAVGSGGGWSGTASDFDPGTGIAAFNVPAYALGVETYTGTVTLSNGYFIATPAEDVLVVYDPSLGFTTGGGWFLWPAGTGNPELEGVKTNFGYTMNYTTNKKNVMVKGGLLLIAHLPDGSIVRIKSNALFGLAILNNTYPGIASFSGKCVYSRVDASGNILAESGNQEFIVYVKDMNEPGTGTDMFWFTTNLNLPGEKFSLDSNGNNKVDESEYVSLGGGNLVVPHTSSSSTSTTEYGKKK